jgi:hypothetical protein
MTDNVPATIPTANRLEELAQAHELEAFALYVETVRDSEAKLEHRLKAADAILERARGKPKVAQPKDPSQRKAKATQMSLEQLMKIAAGAVARVQHEDKLRVQAEALEGEFVPVVRKRPVNEYALVPATNDVEDLLK